MQRGVLSSQTCLMRCCRIVSDTNTHMQRAGETYPEYRDKETGKAISGEDADESVGMALHAQFEAFAYLFMHSCP